MADEKRSAVDTCVEMLSFNDNDLVRAAREELLALRQSVSDAYHRGQGVEIQNAVLRAENAAMREALKATMRCGCSFPAVIVEDDGSRRSVCGLVEAKELARTALGGSHD